MSDIRIISPDTKPVDEIDPFDLDALRVSQDFSALADVEKVPTEVPVCKPNKQAFVRVRPGPEWRVDTLLLEMKEDKRELYLVSPAMRAALAGETALATLYTAVDRQGTLFLWPVRLPGAEGKDNKYWTSARAAVALAETHWVRVVANQSAGFYDIYKAANGEAFPAPDWSNLTFKEILTLAFRHQMIDSVDHPIYKRLRGLA